MSEARPTRPTWWFALITMCGVAGGAAVGARAASQQADPYRDLDTLVRVIGLVENGWVEERDTEDLVDSALRGMVADLDPHSRWLSAEEWSALNARTEGETTGLGVEVRLDAEGATITHVLPDSPAERDGLREGDVVLAIDGAPVDARTVQEGLLQPRGEILLTVRRDGEEREVRTMRQAVEVPAVTWDRTEDDLGYVRLARFSRGAAESLSEALGSLSEPTPLRGLVLDLRDNTGGLLGEAVGTADLFLEDGLIVETASRLPAEVRTYEASPGAFEAPVVVLVNGLSASASEVVAAALQDRGVATLVGEPTYGKGSVQTVYEHRAGGALKLTIGRYLTPSGAPVAPRQGRAPDVEVSLTVGSDPLAALRADLEAHDELSSKARAELLAHLDALPPTEFRSARSEIPWTGTLAERSAADPQLAAALGVLRDAD